MYRRYNVEAASMESRKKQRLAQSKESDAAPQWIVNSFATYQKKKAATIIRMPLASVASMRTRTKCLDATFPKEQALKM